MTQQQDKLKEFGYSQYGEPNPQPQLTTNVGHKGHKLLKKNQPISFSQEFVQRILSYLVLGHIQCWTFTVHLQYLGCKTVARARFPKRLDPKSQSQTTVKDSSGKCVCPHFNILSVLLSFDVKLFFFWRVACCKPICLRGA